MFKNCFFAIVQNCYYQELDLRRMWNLVSICKTSLVEINIVSMGWVLMATHNSVSLSWRPRKSFKLWSLLAICFYLLSFHQNWHQDIWRDRPRPWDIKLFKTFLTPSSTFLFYMFLVINWDFFLPKSKLVHWHESCFFIFSTQ